MSKRIRTAVAGVVVLLTLQIYGSGGFPSSWNIGLSEPINSWQSWIRTNRDNHWLFTFILNPITWIVDLGLEFTESFIGWLPWFIPPIVVFAIIARRGKFVMAGFAAFAVIYPGLVGVWQESIETISLMAVSVGICILLGVPIGVWTALNKRAESILRPILDAMQTVPATVYLIPIVLLFGIGKVPAAIATVIYALPPMIRLTSLGVQQVPRSAIEAGQMFGATKRQILSRIQLPLAVPSIVAGINQTVMMALGIVVIATLVGAGGLGQEINQTVRQLSPGRGLVVSLAVVAVAFVLDRVSMSLVSEPGSTYKRLPRNVIIVAIVTLVVATVIGHIAGWNEFPISYGTSFADPIDTAVNWFRDTFSFITRPFNDFIVRDVLIRAQNLLNNSLSWQLIVAAAMMLSFFVAGWKMAVTTALGIMAIGLTGRWTDSVDTLTQTIVAVALSIAIALPIGVWLGRRPRAEAALSPILDSLQTIPPLIYAIPFVMIFTVGPVPGVVAAVVYAIPPGIRLTSLGIRQVNKESIEAATTFGATDRQVLWGVRIPLAMPSIILAINQMVMMVLAMAIIAGMVGGGGLGYRSIEALTGANKGLGAEVGVAIVIMATILDRLTQATAKRLQAPAAI
ncbi:glycine/betaine ABC transporter permease [Actinomycetes bacterium]|nr:glycine/betaine ABC transporter permease [Actinomycetes bacterium]